MQTASRFARMSREDLRAEAQRNYDMIADAAINADESGSLKIADDHVSRCGRPVEGSGAPLHAPNDRHWTRGIFLVDGVNGIAGHSFGFCPEGYEARRATGGPMVPGPWAYAYPNSHALSDDGGTFGEVLRALLHGRRVYRTAVGGVVEIGGVRFRVEKIDRDNVRLVLIEEEPAAAPEPAEHPQLVEARRELAAAREDMARLKPKGGRKYRDACELVEFWLGRVSMMSIDNPSNPYRTAR